MLLALFSELVPQLTELATEKEERKKQPSSKEVAKEAKEAFKDKED